MENSQNNSVIILKNNSIESDKIPQTEQLELGELALGLVKDFENIWAKNSEGEVINLRSPRPDLFWKHLFLKFETKNDFETYRLMNVIPPTSIVFIGGEIPSIWVDECYYSIALTDEIISDKVKELNLILPKSIIDLTSSSSIEDIESVMVQLGGLDNLIDQCKNSTTIFVKSETATIPVTTLVSKNKLVLSWLNGIDLFTSTIEVVNEKIVVNQLKLDLEFYSNTTTEISLLKQRMTNAESTINSLIDKTQFASKDRAGIVKIWLEQDPITGLYELNIMTE